jgi:hypothetical protein
MLKALIKSLENKHLNPFRLSESAVAENPEKGRCPVGTLRPRTLSTNSIGEEP